MVEGDRRLEPGAGEKGGSETGPSPVDRGRPGSKHHLLVDGSGIPLAFSVTGGNRNDVTQLIPLLNGVPAVRGAIGRPRRRPERLIADRGYDHDKYRRLLWQRGVKPMIARRQTDHGSGLGRHRWVVERTFAWLHNFKRLLIRYERRADMHPQCSRSAAASSATADSGAQSEMTSKRRERACTHATAFVRNSARCTAVRGRPERRPGRCISSYYGQARMMTVGGPSGGIWSGPACGPCECPGNSLHSNAGGPWADELGAQNTKTAVAAANAKTRRIFTPFVAAVRRAPAYFRPEDGSRSGPVQERRAGEALKAGEATSTDWFLGWRRPPDRPASGTHSAN